MLCTYNIMLRCVPATIVAVEKQYVLHTYSECVSVDLGLQCVMRLHHIVICVLLLLRPVNQPTI